MKAHLGIDVHFGVAIRCGTVCLYNTTKSLYYMFSQVKRKSTCNSIPNLHNYISIASFENVIIGKRLNSLKLCNCKSSNFRITILYQCIIPILPVPCRNSVRRCIHFKNLCAKPVVVCLCFFTLVANSLNSFFAQEVLRGYFFPRKNDS